MRVLFAGGGTGGHLYPALSIARAMVAAEPAVRPFFLGARRGIERTVLPTAEFPFELLDLHPLYRQQPWLNWRTLVGGSAAWQRISSVASSEPIAALVATGGYAAGVALGVAARRRIPIVIQEQNSFPGLTVRAFARRAAQIHLGFPEAAERLTPGPATRIFASGNPIQPPSPPEQRSSRAAARAAWGFEAGEGGGPVLLVFGGSQGAEPLNRTVSDWLWSGGLDRAGLRLIWATGMANHGTYAVHESSRVRVTPYISPMEQAYAAADVAISRAGAMTTAELAAWGLPAILVPLPTAAADHQRSNARAMADSGAAVLLEQSQLSATALDHALAGLLNRPGALQAMASAALARARPHAAQDIARHVLALIS